MKVLMILIALVCMGGCESQYVHKSFIEHAESLCEKNGGVHTLKITGSTAPGYRNAYARGEARCMNSAYFKFRVAAEDE